MSPLTIFHHFFPPFLLLTAVARVDVATFLEQIFLSQAIKQPKYSLDLVSLSLSLFPSMKEETFDMYIHSELLAMFEYYIRHINLIKEPSRVIF